MTDSVELLARGVLVGRGTIVAPWLVMQPPISAADRDVPPRQGWPLTRGEARP